MAPEDSEIDVLDVMDRVLSAALREVRSARARRPVTGASVPSPDAGSGSKSQTALCVDILKDAERPLHITALLDALAARGVGASRESLVSAICKKLAPVGPFVRTAPNTFGLAGRDSGEV